jgi:DNA-binding transcriptional ArsR family regulator
MRDLHEPPTSEIRLTEVLHALSDPLRLQVAKRLTEDHECSCSRLGVSVSKSTLSHHLKVLREAGITHTRVVGTTRMVSLRAAELEERFPGVLDSVLAAHDGPARPAAA